ncbi:MAG: glucokinase [Deltaproteobacteria bacterium]|nr:glucokinase [Deltaproteobacteria bacterium]MBZ0220198.1 glucokinase [Deltaproteobacteria bacterium]
MKGERLILAGDIGGTKTYMALYALSAGTLAPVRESVFSNDRYGGPEVIMGEFLKEGEARRIEGAALGLACPIIGNRCTLTNLGWVVDGEELKKRFGLKKLGLINDLEALGWGVGLLGKADLFVLQEGAQRPGNAALIAAGTGLGEAILVGDGEDFRVSASEGGHTDFGPRNALEVELLQYLMPRYGHVSYERIVSGPGLANIYEFLLAKNKRKTPERLRMRMEAEGAAPVISEEAINGTDEDCKEALGLLVSIYGAEAGNLALKSLSIAGVYVGGGIAPKILEALKIGGFLEAFRDKGRFRDFMAGIPVHVILNDRTGLMGAASYAALLAGERAERITGAKGP